ncbi:unnamed protein product [Vicia faba]|uniref:DDE Tnp4 domain-containing protein n=1 Tax=Vicia faba TaxID=3906 RepID=A0AAV0YLE4_VICFA|nr:unnamed protein product [Vicia faba]
MKVSRDYLKFHDYNLDGLEENKWKWFENSIGALDGTHISVTVAAEDRPRYRNRKGDISTNVLRVCGLDLRFIYVLPGWEGSAGDSRVLRDVLRHQNCLRIPKGKYFLVDAGYINGPDEKQWDQFLEAQDLDLLSIVDEELTNQQTERGTTNGVDEVATVQVIEEWTIFRDAYAMKIFAEYQKKRNIS